MKTNIHYLFCLILLGACSSPPPPPEIDYSGPVADWPYYGSAEGGGHYSPLQQITPENVHALQEAWVHRSGDFREADEDKGPLLEPAKGDRLPRPVSSFQVTPIVVKDTLYYCTPYNRVFALNPETGEEIWEYDPKVDMEQEYLTNCRGVSSWIDESNTDGLCSHRIFTGTLDGRLIALDGATGKLCEDFGEGGFVDLNEGLSPHEKWEYAITSPPAIINDLVIPPASVFDNVRLDIPSGVVRAYNVRTGELEWFWDPIPPDAEPAVDENGEVIYQSGSTNVWSIMSVDEERDLLFIPTGNTSPDHYGGLRKGADYYSSSVVALNTNTGEVVWHFQTVHHDVWDYDVASQPTLFELERNGEKIPALAQPTKMGHLFVLHRETGEPLFPVEERPVPQGGVEGEQLSPTQPFPVKPKPLHPATFTPDDVFGFTPWDRGQCREAVENLRAEGIFTPPSLQGSTLYPSNGGGNNWGSPAVDVNSNTIVLNTLRILLSLKLVPREECDKMEDLLKPQLGTPYCAVIEPVLSPMMVPCSDVPFSTLTAIDLNSGDHLWQVPLGTLEDLAPFPFSKREGALSSGGPIITASGLIFIASTTDYYIRAFRLSNGEEIWKQRLPTSGHATPMTYRLSSSGKQYVVIAAGGHALYPAPPGDYLIAYALPDSE